MSSHMYSFFIRQIHNTVASPGFGSRGGGTKVRENNLRVTQKYYEILAITTDKAIDQYTQETT